MLQSNSEVLKMRNYFKNKMKERLNYCHEWKNSVEMYMASKEITKKANEEYPFRDEQGRLWKPGPFFSRTYKVDQENTCCTKYDNSPL